jgi:hypothetical protein
MPTGYMRERADRAADWTPGSCRRGGRIHEESGAIDAGAVFRLWEVNLDGQQIARLEARRHAHELREAARQQPGANEQHQSERHLDDHQRAEESWNRAARAARERVRGVAQPAGARCLKRRDEPGHERDEHRCGEREQHDAGVEPDVLHSRQAAFGERVYESNASPRDEKSQRPADSGEDRTLHENLTEQLSTAGPERRAQGDLVRRLTTARDQVGDVRAHDQEQEADRGRDQHRAAHVTSCSCAARRVLPNRIGPGRSWRGACDDRHLPLRPSERQSPDDARARLARGRARRSIEAERRPDVDATAWRKIELAASADNGVGTASS